jgi:signal transduction histidine kinase
VDGSLWLGTWEGELKRLVEGTPQVVKGGTFPAPITGLVCGSGPALWVATHGAGLFRWEAGQAQRWTTAEGLPTDILLSLDWDAAGTLWIGTAGGGLAWLEEGRFHSVDARQGLGDSVVSQILEDGQGDLWLGCNRGIMRLSKGELRDVASGKAAAVHPLVLDESDGILTAECTGGYSPAGLRSRSGALYFSTVRGVVAVDPARFGPTPVPPAVLIEEVKLDGKTIPMSGGAFSLSPGPRELQIQFTAFNYAKPEQIRFRYRLQGGDEHWVEAEGARSVRFSQLRPGDYTFQVSAANQDGHWQQPGASLVFTVQPFYWQTGWFKVLGLLVFAVVVYASFHRRLIRLKKEHAAHHAFARQLILSQENERKRVSAELHDGLGQNLLLIKNRLAMAASRQADAAELTRQLDAATAATTRAIREVRAISHALRPAALDQVGLTKAIEWMVEQLGESASTKFATELDNIDGLLAPEMEMNLFRIIQEGLNNITRHAGAAQVILEVKREAAGLRVSLFDNGRGFEAEKVRAEPGARPGLGLASMEERANYLRGSLDVQSAPEHGTRVTVRVPLPPTKA